MTTKIRVCLEFLKLAGAITILLLFVSAIFYDMATEPISIFIKKWIIIYFILIMQVAIWSNLIRGMKDGRLGFFWEKQYWDNLVNKDLMWGLFWPYKLLVYVVKFSLFGLKRSEK